MYKLRLESKYAMKYPYLVNIPLTLLEEGDDIVKVENDGSIYFIPKTDVFEVEEASQTQSRGITPSFWNTVVGFLLKIIPIKR